MDCRDTFKNSGDLASKNQKPVQHEKGLLTCYRIQAECYLECSALTGKGVGEVFDNAVRVALESQNKTNSRRLKGCCTII
jgi:hypothetical protein